MSSSDVEITRLVRELAQRLVARGARLATAESCTGGWLAKALTDQPGSSAWFEYGFVTYGNKAKTELLGVSADTLAGAGAVSDEVAGQMATGARLSSAAELAVAITGIAGPGGGTPEKPVGGVWIAWAGPGETLDVQHFVFTGDRDAIRRQSVAAALRGLLVRLGAA